MKFNSKTLLVAALIAIVLAILLSLVMGVPSSLIISFLIAVAFYILSEYNASKKADGGSDKDEQLPQSESDKSIESLLSINILLRKCIMPEKIRDEFEQIIDQLIALLPAVNLSGPDGELAWVINRMATEYLPEKSIKPYIALDEAARNDETTIASVEESLAGMKAELAEVESLLAARKTSEFNSKAKFMKQRFNID